MESQDRGLGGRIGARIPSLLLVLLFTATEILAAFVAYETHGELLSGFYFLLAAANVVLLAGLLWAPRASLAAALALFLLLVPYQVVLGHRLFRVQREAARIVSYAYEHRLDRGRFPDDLTGYEPGDPSALRYIQYSRDESAEPRATGFHVSYFVGTRTTSHWYSSKTGWGYYPD